MPRSWSKRSTRSRRIRTSGTLTWPLKYADSLAPSPGCTTRQMGGNSRVPCIRGDHPGWLPNAPHVCPGLPLGGEWEAYRDVDQHARSARAEFSRKHPTKMPFDGRRDPGTRVTVTSHGPFTTSRATGHPEPWQSCHRAALDQRPRRRAVAYTRSRSNVNGRFASLNQGDPGRPPTCRPRTKFEPDRGRVQRNRPQGDRRSSIARRNRWYAGRARRSGMTTYG